MKFLEEDLEDIIYDTSQTIEGRLKLLDRGLGIVGALQRQVPLGSYGYMDLFGFGCPPHPFGNRTLILQVIELKKGRLDSEHLIQLCRYATGLYRHFTEYINLPDAFENLRIEPILIGKSINEDADIGFLIDHSTIRAYTYEFDLDDGLTFHRHRDCIRNKETFNSGMRNIFVGISTDLYKEYHDLTKHKLEQNHTENGQKTHS